MRTLNADLLTAQVAGYPTGGYQPAVRCIFTSKDGGTTHDYSFNPTLTNNLLLFAEQVEERESDSGIIRIQNYDKVVPADLTGYYVDFGWGHNTSDGIKWDTGAGAVSPRLWVMKQTNSEGGPKGGQPQIYTDFIMAGVWSAILNRQPVRLGTTPLFRYSLDDPLEPHVIEELKGKSIYNVLKYLIETALSDQTGLTFTLEDLGVEDDGKISTIFPFPFGGPLKRTINAETPGRFQTYGEVFISLLELTKCILIPRAGQAFKIIYPEEDDEADITYYPNNVSGHPFYEVLSNRLNMVPNHVEVFGTDPEAVVGNWYDPDHYSSPPAYDGSFMPVTLSLSEDGLDTVAEANARADAEGRQLKDRTLGTRVIIPMDAKVELYDMVLPIGRS